MRIDAALNVEPAGTENLVIGDSTAIRVNMDRRNGVKEIYNNEAGTNLPAIFIWYRVASRSSFTRKP